MEQAKEVRRVPVGVRLTTDEYTEVYKRAQARKLKMGAYIRELVLEKLQQTEFGL